MARRVAGLAARLKQPVIVDNKPGASAQVARSVAKAKPDGYTLFMTTNTSHSANPALVKEPEVRPDQGLHARPRRRAAPSRWP